MPRARATVLAPATPARRIARIIGRSLLVAPLAAALATAAVEVPPALGAVVAHNGPTGPGWCAAHGSSLVGWTATAPNLPICGVGPAYGGSWRYVDLPGPHGNLARYFGATPGFQCVELADRFLAVVYGLAPVEGNGEAVAANYHAAYPATHLYVNGTAAAIHHAPQPGDVLSLSSTPSFEGGSDGHVAVVVRSAVDSAGNGAIVVAQENVSSTDYHKRIDVVGWRLEDPQEPSDPEFQFPYAEWLHVATMPSVLAARHRVVARRHEALVAARRRAAAARRAQERARRGHRPGAPARRHGR